MHVLAVVLAWPPTAIGGPIASAELLKELASRGHEVTVLSRCEKRADLAPDSRGALCRSVDGVTIMSTRGWRFSTKHAIRDVDVVYAHPDLSNNNVRPLGWDVARSVKAPLVYALHNMKRSTHVMAKQWPPNLFVWNSEATRAFSEVPRSAGVIVRPRLHVADHTTAHRGSGDAVTLINVSHDKGADVFFELAKRFPETRFIGVRGGYNPQTSVDLPNVEICGPYKREELPEKVWSRTKVLLMPSRIEAWGMSALEAACSGIPTIGSPAIGLVEALGQSGMFADVDDIDGWETALRSLLSSPARYISASANAFIRATAVEQQTAADLVELDRALRAVSKQNAPDTRLFSERSWKPSLDVMMSAHDANALAGRH